MLACCMPDRPERIRARMHTDALTGAALTTVCITLSCGRNALCPWAPSCASSALASSKRAAA